MSSKLTFIDHSRKFRDFKYVYPVLSRRAEGISIGVNLNINNACNWRCIYCQVDGLIRGKPVKIELEQLEYELNLLLNEMVVNNSIQYYATGNLARINDISISGNGEPTLSEDFFAACDIIIKLKTKYQLDHIKIILITNGSNIKDLKVQAGLILMSQHNGEVWFKVDSVTDIGIKQVNQINLSSSQILNGLSLTSNLCKTWIQSCFFMTNDKLPDNEEIRQYIKFLVYNKNLFKGVFLYTIARTPMLIEGSNLKPVDFEFLQNIASQLAKDGILVKSYV
jgi:wyosine [tRNA(Phe)-imidazoG37] synthetase (radical SAM superfamily)